MMEKLPRERLGCAMQAIGHARGTLKITTEYLTEPKAFGQNLSQFQNTRFKLADIKVELELCQALVEKYLVKFARDEMTIEQAAVVKYATTEMQLRVVNECL